MFLSISVSVLHHINILRSRLFSSGAHLETAISVVCGVGIGLEVAINVLCETAVKSAGLSQFLCELELQETRINIEEGIVGTRRLELLTSAVSSQTTCSGNGTKEQE
jgi:hypothetical protein